MAKCCKCFRNFFPKFAIKSVTFILVIILLVVFIATNLIGMGYETWSCCLYNFGAKYTRVIQRGQVHRLITAGFLHDDFFHIFWNVLSLFIIGFQSEDRLGVKKYIGLLAVSLIGGNILSAATYRQTLSVGASGMIYGILGYLLVWFKLNYNRLGPYKTFFLIFIGIILFFSIFNMLFGQSSSDVFAHLGGLVAGLLFTLIVYVGETEEET